MKGQTLNLLNFNSFIQAGTLFFKMSTRSQKRKAYNQENTENVSEILVSPVLAGGVDSSEPDVMVAGPSKAKPPRVEE